MENQEVAVKSVFHIPVTRVGYAYHTFTVEAESEKEAFELVDSIAGDYEFSERESEYIFPGDQNLEFLHKHLNSNPELAAFIYELINCMVGYDVRRLITLVKGKEYNQKIDTARPQEWVNQMIDEMLITPYMFVWDYNERSFGAPLNVAEVTLTKLKEIASKSF